jgi:hypothetical protein
MIGTNIIRWKIPLTGILLLIAASLVYSQEEYIKKEDKTFKINKNSELRINNKYGDIDIRDWPEDKLSIKVEIIIRDVSKQKSDEMFGQVNIEISQEGNVINVATNYTDEFFNLAGKNFANDDKKFEIKYLIMLPPWLKVDAENKYGDIFISKLTSQSTIRVRYGTLKINQLLADSKENMAEVDLAYSKGSIEECSWSRIAASYSKLVIEESKALIAITKYSKLFIDHGSSLVCESKYDSYELGTISNFVTESKYSNIKIDKLGNKLILDTKYTDTKIGSVTSGFDLVEIDNSYGSIRLGIDPAASYYLEGFAKYARISYGANPNVNLSQENTEMRVDGLIGNDKRTKSKVKIETNYGGVIIAQ